MVWANFLHFYQPPTQKKYWVDRVTAESYRPLVQGLLANPNIRLTLNVNTVLCDLWVQYGHQDVIAGIRTLVTRGQVELTGSAKFHPLLPKMPKSEITRQIILNEQGLEKYFGVVNPRIYPNLSELRPNYPNNSYNSEKIGINSDSGPRLRGFFPPEMAYDRYVAKVVAEMGYEWILAEELSYSQKLGTVKNDRIYEIAGIHPNLSELRPNYPNIQISSDNSEKIRNNSDKNDKNNVNSQFKIFFRDRGFSWRILSGQLGTPKLFLTTLGERVNNNEYLLTAMDGETFGHHRPGMERQLFDIYNNSGVKSVTISELPALFTKREATETLPSTWALMESEVMKNEPFSRWADPTNEIHTLQWELTELAIAAVNIETPNMASLQHNSVEARNLLDRALHSDQYWWASARPWWSLEMIERGAYELLEAVKATDNVTAGQKAQELYYQIITTGFKWQRDGKVDEMAKAEDESVRMLTDKGMASLPAEELDKMIETIRQELTEVVKHEEFERAIQLRDRIKELERYKGQ